MADDKRRPLVRVGVRLGVPTERQFIGLSLDVRVTTFHLLLSGAIATAVLYLVKELVRTERELPRDARPGAQVRAVAS